MNCRVALLNRYGKKVTKDNHSQGQRRQQETKIQPSSKTKQKCIKKCKIFKQGQERPGQGLHTPMTQYKRLSEHPPLKQTNTPLKSSFFLQLLYQETISDNNTYLKLRIDKVTKPFK